AKAHGVPIRIGVNAGSLERALYEKHGGATPQAMVESALSHAALLEAEGFYDIVISLKASSVQDTVAAYEAMAAVCPYPLHIGVTEAGSGAAGLVKSAAGLGILLHECIGDTLRVSLTGEPVQEVEAARLLLRAMGLRREGTEIISCPTCGRTGFDLLPVVRRVEAALPKDGPYLKVAVMGCVVNGPGEARDADVGIAFGGGKGVLFAGGEKLGTFSQEQAIETLIEEAKRRLGQAAQR
ncbi:MAG: flavodoxin-dependent (E)-4-hydroxy-3-methylbut-2-enyl-diphosphate synthase, partial [Clostridia bacterium]|nr:flavodoxin-dependent (E)-4-hydroxy-3-methylbut-2-enyl-diphosphate synthase [Clostridia bacterium]